MLPDIEELAWDYLTVVITKYIDVVGIKCKYTLVNYSKCGCYISWYLDGTVRSKSFYINGCIIETTEYHNNGKLARQFKYKLTKYGSLVNSDYDGLFEMWYDDGRIQERYNLIDGVIIGWYRYWHQNGKLCGKGYYMNGRKHGEYKEWYDNGKLESQYKYVNGIKHGDYTKWDRDGKITEKCKYIFGEIGV